MPVAGARSMGLAVATGAAAGSGGAAAGAGVCALAAAAAACAGVPPPMRWNSTNAMSCGCPSSVTVKSFAVSPSMTLPSLSFTVTVWTTRRVVVLKTGCWVCCCGCAAPPCALSAATTRTTDNSQRPTPQLPTLGVAPLSDLVS